MAKAGLRTLVVLLVFIAPAFAGGEPDLIADRIAMQKAIQQGRDLLVHKNFDTAVQILEAQLEHIHGDREYLMLLRDAYREHVRELHLANRDAEALVYQRRLQYIDPGAVLDTGAPQGGDLCCSSAGPGPEPASNKHGCPWRDGRGFVLSSKASA